MLLNKKYQCIFINEMFVTNISKEILVKTDSNEKKYILYLL